MSPGLQWVSVFKKSGPSTHVSPPCEEAVLGPASLEERGDRRKPRGNCYLIPLFRAIGAASKLAS